MDHSPVYHLAGRAPFPQVSSSLPQEHVEMVMLALVSMLDQCSLCTDTQVSWVAADPERMLTLYELMQIFAEGIGIATYRPAPEWAALELAVLSRVERERMVVGGLTLLGNMIGRVLGYVSGGDGV